MKKMFLNSCLNLIKKHGASYNQDEIDRILYGLEAIYLTVTKSIILLSVSAILGIFKEFLLLSLFFSLARSFAFGLHLSKSHTCLLLSGSIFITFTYLATVLTLSIITKVIILVACFVLFYIYAPADTHKRPLINNKKRLRCKFMSLFIVAIYSFFIFYTKSSFLANCLLFSLLIELLMILPISYKILKMPYNNYKTYVHNFN